MSWAISGDVRRGNGRVLYLELVDADRKLRATVRRDEISVDRDELEEHGRCAGDRFQVAFSPTCDERRRDLYARAEAARLFAQVCDTAGDLYLGDRERERGDDPLHVKDPAMVGSMVELIGRDAGVCVGVFFDEPVTSELMDLFY